MLELRKSRVNSPVGGGWLRLFRRLQRRQPLGGLFFSLFHDFGDRHRAPPAPEALVSRFHKGKQFNRFSRLDRSVAVKILPTGFAEDAERRQRFEIPRKKKNS